MKKTLRKLLADMSNHFVRHYENVSSDCRSNINSLIENIGSSVQKVYTHTADKVLKKVHECKTINNVHKNKQWFNKECLIKRKELRLITKALNRNSNDSRLRQSFCNLKKHYRRLCRKLKRKHEQELLCKLEKLHHTDTESFWKLLRQVKGDKGQTLQNQREVPPLEKSSKLFQGTSPEVSSRISSQGKSKYLKRLRH